MANVAFTRDEAILTLDVLYNSGTPRLNSTSEQIAELSALLQKLPIYSYSFHGEPFRNETGISRQVYLFKSSLRTGVKDPNVGKLFFTVAFEYENKLDELHEVAQSIRRNLKYFDAEFGAAAETDGFPEGALLGHLHRLIESKYGDAIPTANKCSICEIEPDRLYKGCSGLLKNHLTVSPTQMDGGVKYSFESFITVCPNCHAALHRHRPWLNKENCGDLLC